MDRVKIGNRFRALRHRRGWRQADLALRAKVSQDLVSLLERGRLDQVSLERAQRVAHEMDAELVVALRWRGGDLDRLADEAHAHLVGRAVEILKELGWLVRIEVSYSVYGERGSIDILAFEPTTRTLLVVEVKTEVVALEETLRKHDEKVRLAPRIATEQLDWRPTSTARLLVVPSDSTARRRIDRHAAVIRAAYPMAGLELRRWLASPTAQIARGASIGGVLFVSTDPGRASPTGPQKKKRIRSPSARPEPSGRLPA